MHAGLHHAARLSDRHMCHFLYAITSMLHCAHRLLYMPSVMPPAHYFLHNSCSPAAPSAAVLAQHVGHCCVAVLYHTYHNRCDIPHPITASMHQVPTLWLWGPLLCFLDHCCSLWHSVMNHGTVLFPVDGNKPGCPNSSS